MTSNCAVTAPITIGHPVDAPFMISSLSSAMSGMADAASRFDRGSARVARSESSDPVHGVARGLVGDQVAQITAQHDFAANVATVRTADEMIGTLIDIVA